MANLEERILECARYIEANYTQKLSLEDLAERFAISAFHLQRQFSERLGVSPKQFQTALRIQALKQSVRSGDEISDAIYASGFGSPSRVYENIDNTVGMSLSAYKNKGEAEHIYFSIRETKVGKILMAATERGVCFVHIGDSYSTLLQSLYKEFPAAQLTPTPEDSVEALDHWIIALEEHLSSHRPLPNIPLDLRGTLFQIQVWKFLSSTNKSDTLSYSELAKSIGRPKAFRAVANACGANNIAILIPCHRVLRGDGSIGGYRWGVERKEKLLAFERAAIEEKE